MTKRLHHSSSSSSSDIISDFDDENLDEYLFLNRLPCRTIHSGRYQSDIYTGLISQKRLYSNGKLFTRLEQLITLFHDDQIRCLLLLIRHYSMKHNWSKLLIYLKDLLQSSYCRSYIRLYWQLTFRYLLNNDNNQTKIDMNLLPQTFDELFHSPTINRTQTFYSYLCLFLIKIKEEKQIDHYYDIETRYKNFNFPHLIGRCKHLIFDQKLEQLFLVKLQFLINYRQWLITENENILSNNPFFQKSIINIENEREIELWTFKLTTDFNEIKLISNQYFDIYDIFLLKYIHFLYSTQTYIEQIENLLNDYIEKHLNYINSYKYFYWYNSNLKYLKCLIELDPSSTPYVLIYCQYIKSNSIECIDRIFDYLDYDKNRNDIEGWKIFCEQLLTIEENNQKLIQSIRDNWLIRKTIWCRFHFGSIKNMNYFQAIIAYIFLENENQRKKIRQKFQFEIDIDQVENLHQQLKITSNI